jgi:phosphoribosylformylglycinamidine synthase
MIARVYVTLKQGILDPQGKAVERSLHALGFPQVGEVRIGKYIELRLTAPSVDQAKKDVEEICNRLLANTVIEDYRYEIDG